MNQKLVRQLKKAGFPLEINLKTLMEECGMGCNIHPTNQGDGWMATNGLPDYFCKGEGKIPEEAVARLWLELNKYKSLLKSE